MAGWFIGNQNIQLLFVRTAHWPAVYYWLRIFISLHFMVFFAIAKLWKMSKSEFFSSGNKRRISAINWRTFFASDWYGISTPSRKKRKLYFWRINNMPSLEMSMIRQSWEFWRTTRTHLNHKAAEVDLKISNGEQWVIGIRTYTNHYPFMMFSSSVSPTTVSDVFKRPIAGGKWIKSPYKLTFNILQKWYIKTNLCLFSRRVK